MIDDKLKVSYQFFLSKYINKLKELNPINDFEDIQIVNKIFDSVQKCIKKLINGMLPIENIIILLNSIKFQDYEMDFEIISKIQEINSGVYIKKDDKNYDDFSFYLLKNINGEDIMFKDGNYNQKEVNIDLSNYVLLENLLDNLTYVGKNAVRFNNLSGISSIYVLCENDKVYFYVYKYLKDHVHIGNKKSYLDDIVAIEKEQSLFGLDYKNLQLLLEDIRKRLETNYQNSKSNKKISVFY